MKKLFLLCLLFVGFTRLYSYDLTSGLVAYYPFTGGSLNDFSGNGHNANNYGSLNNKDRFGTENQAKYFDGSSYINIPSQILSPNKSSYTINVWIKNEKSETSIIMTNRKDDCSTIYCLACDFVSYWNSMYYRPSELNQTVAYTTKDTIKGWKMLTFVYNSDKNLLEEYFNGSFVNSVASSVYPSMSTGTNIGAWQGCGHGPHSFYIGAIDDIRIYNLALSDAEVNALYNLEKPPVEEVTIGTQTWMKKNLDVAYYRDGTPIPQITDPTEWTNATDGAWCYYNNDPANGAIYGKLYNWYAVNSPHGLAPEGWHVASENEWRNLETILGMPQTDIDNWGWRGTTEGGKLKEIGFNHWLSPNTNATNETGFTALPG